MKLPKIDIDRFRKIFDVPAFMVPWLDRFFEDSEIRLVLLLGEKPLRITEIVEKWKGAGSSRPLNELQGFVERCYKRGIIGKCDDGRLQPADFHARFDIWAMFEGWKDLPAEIRDRLNEWELDYYQRQHVDQIDTLKKGGRRDPSKTWPAYILLHEAEALIDRVDHVYLWPCNCRSMVGRCRQNVYTCLRFSNKRDVGWEISKSRAKDILRKANKSGLMQNGEVSVAPDGSISGAICNCCADCCFPHQIAERLDAHNLWPLTRYVARHLKDRCTACGRCVKSCAFQAFTLNKAKLTANDNLVAFKERKPEILFDESVCRVCGVCSTSCPENAIEMIRLDDVNSVWEDLIYDS